jgi:hypothetical protein
LPFDLAFSAPDDFVVAWVIAHGENNGGSFDWQTWQWAKK